MPGGLAFDSTQSYIAFAAIKFVGYTGAALFYNSRYIDRKANPLLFGLARTVLGMSLGAVVGLLGLVALELAMMFFLFGLLPFRIAEWYSTLWVFYRHSERFRSCVGTDTLLGIAWSFALDIPAVIGFLATGGLWIC